ncbi:MAG: chemotaxis protein CheW [Deltaproteobacteria bacterium]|nr:chemotaxis protein CheW [Deltaproteobacteria bacterium]
MTEKTIAEEDLKGLEREIDAAVDLLFVEKGGEPLKSASASPPSPGTSKGMEKEVKREMPLPAPLIPSHSRSIEKLETQLFSLEWEITQENIRRTVEEAIALREDLKETPEITPVLNRMVMVLNYMNQNEEGIQPHLIRFLLDSKETIKLLMRKEAGGDIAIYKKLAHAGIEARFLGLEGLHEVKSKPSSVKTEMDEEKAGASLMRPEWMEKIIERMEPFSEKLDEMIEKMNQHLSAHERLIEIPAVRPGIGRPLKMKVTVFKTGEKLLGVESDKVFKLFKVPSPFCKKMIHLGNVRLKGLEVRMIDLGKFFSVSGEDQEEERQVLILKGDEEYKGLMMDRVLNRLSGPLEQAGGSNEYLLGMIRWTYEDLPVKVPILDFEKL